MNKIGIEFHKKLHKAICIPLHIALSLLTIKREKGKKQYEIAFQSYKNSLSSEKH